MVASSHKVFKLCLTMENLTDSFHSLGGKARAERLSAEKKTEIGNKGALMRWGAKATHHGNFMEKFGMDIDCYVLDDRLKTAVISQRGMAAALGLRDRGDAFPRFMGNKVMLAAAGPEIRDKIAQPIKFQWASPGPDKPPGTIFGYDVTLLIDICQAIVSVEKKLGERHADRIRQAHVLLGASAKSGIKGLVYALAGFNPTADEVISAFKAYVMEEAKKYEKEFPPELYTEWYRLYQIPVIEGRGRPWHFKQLTLNHVYYPLAQSNGKVLELMRASKARGGDRRKKLFQFLSEIGARALARQLGRVLEMCESSHDKADYERKIVARFGGQEEFDLTVADAPPELTPSTSHP